MGRNTAWAAILVIVGLCGTGCTTPKPFRVLSFNVRYDNPDDGPNSWTQRRDLVVETIVDQEADVICLQEVLAPQVNELCAALPDYGFVGAGREDGFARGEYVPIFYSKDRFLLVDEGHFWLSDFPERAGSVGWDAALPRVVTWVQLRFKDAPLAQLRVLNVHFDHRGERARLESAKLIRRLVESMGGVPVVVLGDFNCVPGSAPHRTLTEDRRNLTALVDAMAVCKTLENVGTYHGFTGRPSRGRIDWIMLNRRLEPLSAEVDRREWEGRYPSDHFPVAATVGFRASVGSHY